MEKIFKESMGEIILKDLLEGNKRFVSGVTQFPRVDKDRRLEVLNKQIPKAIILGCADSRTSPEFIFNQGIGDLFVLRTAGNILDDVILASIDYAVLKLHVPLIVVLSHSNCGAVELAAKSSHNKVHHQLEVFAKEIKSAVEYVRDSEGDLIDNAIKENARQMVKKLKEHGEIIQNAIQSNKLHIVSAYYDMKSGVIEIL